jgi:hypothetical protein
MSKSPISSSLGRLRPLFFISIFVCVTGCTVAIPEVTSLLSVFNKFALSSHDLSIDDPSLDLTAVVINASCDENNTSFEYELSDDSPGTWSPVIASSLFTSVTDLCSSTGTLSLVADFSTVSSFSAMTIGQTRRITFRDVNLTGVSKVEEFRITFSSFTMADSRVNNGQGLNNTKTGSVGNYTLQGRITNVNQYPTVTGSVGNYTLQGKAVFQ